MGIGIIYINPPRGDNAVILTKKNLSSKITLEMAVNQYKRPNTAK